jgi:hypothetical protein
VINQNLPRVRQPDVSALRKILSHTPQAILALVVVLTGLLCAHDLVASEPTVSFNGWTNTPGVLEGTITPRPIDTTVPAPPLGYMEYLPKGYNQADTATKWPLVVFMGGEGEDGDGTNTAANGYQLQVKIAHHGPFHLMAAGNWDFPAVVVGIQSPGPWNNASIMLQVVLYMQARYNIDNSHLYLTGVSSAADGVLNFASNHPNFFTAINPMSCGLTPSSTAAAANMDTPMWIEHDFNDPLNARTNSISWVDAVTADEFGSSDVMSTYPGYNGLATHEALTVSSTSSAPANRAGPVTEITGCTLTNGSTWIAFGSPANFGSVTFNTWGSTDAYPYASVNLGATQPDTTPSNNIINIGKANGVYLTQPYTGTSSASSAITIQIPVGNNETAFYNTTSATWAWEAGNVWDQSQSQTHIFTMDWYLDHQMGWIQLYAVGDFWNWMFTQSQTLAPAITSPTTYTVTIGSPCTYTIAATNTPTGFNASALPPGLSFNTGSGAITGTPTATGSTMVTLSATNGEGTGYAPVTINVTPPVPVITSATSASTVVGAAYSYAITASNGPTLFDASPIPTGMTFSATTGVISGAPTVVGTTAIAISAGNSTGTGASTLNLTVTNPPPVISGASTAVVTVGDAFSYQIVASNSPTNYGATPLPTNLSVDPVGGTISGTVAAAGTTVVNLTATNAGGTGSATLAITANDPTPVITSATSASGTMGTAFSYQITASGNPTGFGASGLPLGLSVDGGTGIISGTPIVAGTTSATISATNGTGTGSTSLSISIAAVGTTTGGTTSTGTTTGGTTSTGTTTGGTTATGTTGGTTATGTTGGTTATGTTGGTATGTTGGTTATGTTGGTTAGTATGTTGSTAGSTTGTASSTGTATGSTGGTTATGTGTGSGSGTTTAAGTTAAPGSSSNGSSSKCGVGAALGLLISLVLSLRRRDRRI